ncbi:hypothetical protein J6590_074088, partial [Homalodisca vitripennis]
KERLSVKKTNAYKTPPLDTLLRSINHLLLNPVNRLRKLALLQWAFTSLTV